MQNFVFLKQRWYPKEFISEFNQIKNKIKKLNTKTFCEEKEQKN